MSAEGEFALMLTGVEATLLDDLEVVVGKGLAAFVEVGSALETIRDKRLYRAEHASFEIYLQERWRISRSYAYRQIEAAQVVGTVSPMGDIPAPASERVTRELGPLKHQPEQARQAWQETVREHGPRPTASQVREVVKRKKPARTTPAELTGADVENMGRQVVARCLSLGRAIAHLTTALREGPDVDLGFAHADLLRFRQVLDDLIAKLDFDPGDSGADAEMRRIEAKFGKSGVPASRVRSRPR